jgi:hypothetical protein
MRRRVLLLLWAGLLGGGGTSVFGQDVLYATSGPISPNLITVDPDTGSILTSVPITGEEALFGGLSHDGTTLWSIDGFNDGLSDRTFKIDPATGAGMVVGMTGFNWNFRSVEIHPPTGVLYATRDNELYTLDKVTGVATSVNIITGATLDQATALAIDGDGNAYMTDIDGTGLFQLNLVTGQLTHIGDLAIGTWFQDLAFDGSGQLWGVVTGGGVHTIDIANVTTEFRFNSSGWGGMAFEPAQEGRVGGRVLGMTPVGVTCRNLTTGQTINVPTKNKRWDCKALGLIIRPGDLILTGAKGTAN